MAAASIAVFKSRVQVFLSNRFPETNQNAAPPIALMVLCRSHFQLSAAIVARQKVGTSFALYERIEGLSRRRSRVRVPSLPPLSPQTLLQHWRYFTARMHGLVRSVPPSLRDLGIAFSWPRCRPNSRTCYRWFESLASPQICHAARL
jgi:hypothetical protein